MGSTGVNRNTVNTSEARRMSKEEAQSLLTAPIATAELDSGLKPTAYAERLFRYFYRISRDHVNAGNEVHDGWGGGFYINQETDPALSQRAAKGVQQLINKEVDRIEFDVRLGVFSVDEGNRRRKALDMVQKSLNNAVRRNREDEYSGWRR